MNPKTPRLLARVTVALASTLLTWLIVEVSFYRYFPQPTYAVKLSPWGFEHVPNISFKHTPESKETVSYVTYNSEGFRGSNEYSMRKPSDTLRVAILGDSYAEGAEVDYQYLHATVLERMLTQYLAGAKGTYRRAEVIKAGVYAYDSCQELRLFESRVQKYKPDVVFVIYTGELHENQNFCRLEGETLEYVDMRYTGFQYLRTYVAGYVKAKSHSLNYLGRVAQYAFGAPVFVPEQLNRTFAYAPPTMRDLEAATATTDRRFENYLGLDQGDSSSVLPQDYAHRLLFAIFDRFGEQASESGAKLFIGFSHFSSRDSALAHYAQPANIGLVDLFSYINDSRTRPAHLARDGHWNEYGHFLVAKALFEVVRRQLLRLGP